MGIKIPPFTDIPDAVDVPFDNSSNGFTSDNAQDAIEEAQASAVGKGFQLTYHENGSATNTWIEHEGANIPSDEAPGVVPWDARLVGITFTNDNRNVDTQIQIAISNFSTTNSNIDRAYKWQLTNVRSAVWTNETTGFTVNKGDRIGIYMADQGGNASDVVVKLYFIVTNNSNGELTENHTGDMDSDDFPGTIPDVFS